MGETTEGDEGGGGFFSGALRVEADERAELLSGLGQLDDRLERAGAAGLLGWRPRAVAVLEPVPGLDRPVGRPRWLDLVADLLESSTAIARRGLVLEALAMEGVASRLLGVLLGDGPEGPALLEGG